MCAHVPDDGSTFPTQCLENTSGVLHTVATLLHESPSQMTPKAEHGTANEAHASGILLEVLLGP